MRSPPSAVRLVLEALCILLGISPEKARDKNGFLVNDYWTTATKFILNNPSLIDHLLNFNKSQIPQVINIEN